MSGLDLRTAEEIWRKLAESEARLHLMVELGDMEVGFLDVEDFGMELEGKYRATVTGGSREKARDSRDWQKYQVRKEIEEEFGKNNRKGRNIIKNLRKEAVVV